MTSSEGKGQQETATPKAAAGPTEIVLRSAAEYVLALQEQAAAAKIKRGDDKEEDEDDDDDDDDDDDCMVEEEEVQQELDNALCVWTEVLGGAEVPYSVPTLSELQQRHQEAQEKRKREKAAAAKGKDEEEGRGRGRREAEDEVFSALMTKLGTTYSEQEHGGALRKVAVAEATGPVKVLSRAAFTDWYVRWLFRNDDDDDDDVDDDDGDGDHRGTTEGAVGKQG